MGKTTSFNARLKEVKRRGVTNEAHVAQTALQLAVAGKRPSVDAALEAQRVIMVFIEDAEGRV